jgi:hypothetical protein
MQRRTFLICTVIQSLLSNHLGVDSQKCDNTEFVTESQLLAYEVIGRNELHCTIEMPCVQSGHLATLTKQESEQ